LGRRLLCARASAQAQQRGTHSNQTHHPSSVQVRSSSRTPEPSRGLARFDLEVEALSSAETHLSFRVDPADFVAATPCIPRTLALNTEPYGSVYDDPT
jgi:hypothetical protein